MTNNPGDWAGSRLSACYAARLSLLLECEKNREGGKVTAQTAGRPAPGDPGSGHGGRPRSMACGQKRVSSKCGGASPTASAGFFPRLMSRGLWHGLDVSDGWPAPIAPRCWETPARGGFNGH